VGSDLLAGMLPKQISVRSKSNESVPLRLGIDFDHFGLK